MCGKENEPVLMWENTFLSVLICISRSSLLPMDVEGVICFFLRARRYITLAFLKLQESYLQRQGEKVYQEAETEKQIYQQLKILIKVGPTVQSHKHTRVPGNSVGQPLTRRTVCKLIICPICKSQSHI